jgi:hypothetical protein
MARPRTTKADVIQNLFFDMAIEDQDSMLDILRMLNRLKKRQPEAIEDKKESDKASAGK